MPPSWCGGSLDLIRAAEARSFHDLVSRLFHGSRYRFGRSIETLLNAIDAAFGSGADWLGNEHFAQVWAMQEGCPPGQNVFLVDDWVDITLDIDGDEQPARRRSRRR